MIIKKPGSNTTRTLLIFLVITVVLSGFSLYLAAADPQGATISSFSVDTGPTKSPESRSDLGGRIITVVLNLEQQNFAWKAYVGNVTGTYVLQNANNFSIYEWPLGASIQGEVYISRASNVNYTSGAILCANDTTMNTEQVFFGMSSSDTDSINMTFNTSLHRAFSVGSNPIGLNSCPAIATWVNDTAQTPGAGAVFQEVAIYDYTGSNLVYVALINDSETGFDNTTVYDFQAIIPENRSAITGTAYYFYVELGS